MQDASLGCWKRIAQMSLGLISGLRLGKQAGNIYLASNKLRDRAGTAAYVCVQTRRRVECILLVPSAWQGWSSVCGGKKAWSIYPAHHKLRETRG